MRDFIHNIYIYHEKRHINKKKFYRLKYLIYGLYISISTTLGLEKVSTYNIYERKPQENINHPRSHCIQRVYMNLNLDSLTHIQNKVTYMHEVQ